MYEVVYPLGRARLDEKPMAAPLKTLEGKTIAALSNHKFRVEMCFDVLEKTLQSRFPGLKMIHHSEFGDTYGPEATEVVKALPAKLKALKVDAVISGNAG